MPEQTGKPSLQGRFITFEGIDGCGKTTQARRLAKRLREHGADVLETREPGGTAIGQQLRAVLLNRENQAMNAYCELLLYLADRVQHLEQVVRPALERGETVLCDRFHDATVAYQHHGRGLDLTPFRDFLERQVLTTRPDLTVWLDLDVVTAQSRIQARTAGAGAGRAGTMESGRHPVGQGSVGEFPVDQGRLDSEPQPFHERVRAGYAAIQAAEPERVVRVDAGGNEEGIHGQIWALLTGRYHVV